MEGRCRAGYDRPQPPIRRHIACQQLILSASSLPLPLNNIYDFLRRFLLPSLFILRSVVKQESILTIEMADLIAPIETAAQSEKTDETLASTGFRISNRFATLNGNLDAGSSESPYKTAIINESQRFELWAVNLGLYHGGHSSLDYRLRDAPEVFEFVENLFGDLDGAIVQRKTRVILFAE